MFSNISPMDEMERVLARWRAQPSSELLMDALGIIEKLYTQDRLGEAQMCCEQVHATTHLRVYVRNAPPLTRH